MEPSSWIKPGRIEALSDMVFGLALAISAVELAFRPPNNATDIATNLVEFCLSFSILIAIWISYTRLMDRLPIERDRTLAFNVALLLVVSLEPYLLNALWLAIFEGKDPMILQAVSVVFAIDLAAMMILLALMTRDLYEEISAELTPPSRRGLRRVIYWRLGIGVALLATAAPPFWSLAWTSPYTLPDVQIPLVVHLRYLVWIVLVGGWWVGLRSFGVRIDSPRRSPKESAADASD